MSMGATCSANSVDGNAVCNRAIDGNENTDFYRNSCFHSAVDDTNPWMRIDLGKTAQVDKITIVNRFPGFPHLSSFIVKTLPFEKISI